MKHTTIATARTLIVILLAALVASQFAAYPIVADLAVAARADLVVIAPIVTALVILFLACVEAVLICVWRLLAMVRADSIFSPRSFAWVDAILVAVLVATCLVAVVAVLVTANRAGTPALTLLAAGAIVVGIGIGLVVSVMKGLLRRATELEQDMSEVV
jgi:hypothetical protein